MKEKDEAQTQSEREAPSFSVTQEGRDHLLFFKNKRPCTEGLDKSKPLHERLARTSC
jgi:hypothetical protein